MIKTIKAKLLNKKKLLTWPVLGAAGAAACIPGAIVVLKKLKNRKVAD